jgi:hypothetical protein
MHKQNSNMVHNFNIVFIYLVTLFYLFYLGNILNRKYTPPDFNILYFFGCVIKLEIYYKILPLF